MPFDDPFLFQRLAFFGVVVFLDAKISCEYIGSFLEGLEALPNVQKGSNLTYFAW